MAKQVSEGVAWRWRVEPPLVTTTVIAPTSPASDTKRKKRRASIVVVEEEKELHVPAKKEEKRLDEVKEDEAEPEMKAAAMDLDEQQQQQNLEEGQEAATVPALPTTLTHSLQLRSCYAQSISLPLAPPQPLADKMLKADVNWATTGEPACTTFVPGGCRATVDYIFYGPGLATAAVCEMQPPATLEQYRGLPTQTWSSDHMSLVADLVFL